MRYVVVFARLIYGASGSNCFLTISSPISNVLPVSPDRACISSRISQGRRCCFVDKDKVSEEVSGK